mgnify:CR=1 FL=1
MPWWPACATSPRQRASDRALELIARYGTGSVRDAISLLDQAMTFGGDGVTIEAVRAMLGAGRSEAAAQLAAAVVRRDVPAGLRLINQALADGLDLRQFNRDVVEYLRGVLLAKAGASVQELAGVTEETAQEMIELAQQIETSELLHAVRLFAEADSALRHAAQPQLPLELALVESALGAPPRQEAPAAPAPSLRAPRSAPAPASLAERTVPRMHGPAPSRTPAPVPDGQEHRPADAADVESAAGMAAAAVPLSLQEMPAPQPSAEDRAPAGVPGVDPLAATPRSATSPDLERVRQVWDQVLALVRRDSRSLEAILRDARPVRFEGGVLTLEFDYAFHRQRADETENRIILERALRRAVGAELQVRTILAGSAQPSSRRTRYTSPASDPFVLKAARILGARVVDDE